MEQKEIIINTSLRNITNLHESVLTYIDDNTESLNQKDDIPENYTSGVEVLDYAQKPFKESKSKPIILSFKSIGFNKSDDFIVVIESKVYGFKRMLKTSKKRIYIYNLIPLTAYNWYVVSEDGKFKSKIGTFTITNSYRIIYTPHSINIRDIGGKKTHDGRTVKYGLLYRGFEINKRNYIVHNTRDDHGCLHARNLFKSDYSFYYDLGFKVEIDFRFDNESGYQLESDLNSKEYQIDYFRYPLDGYTKLFDEIASNQRYKEQICILFNHIANADKKPLYLHCWGGADRTGTICLLLEMILGVTMADIVIDYELTAFYGNITRFKAYDVQKDPGYRENNNMHQVMEWISKYKKRNETIQDAIIRYLINDVGVLPNNIKKIQEIFLH